MASTDLAGAMSSGDMDSEDEVRPPMRLRLITRRGDGKGASSWGAPMVLGNPRRRGLPTGRRKPDVGDVVRVKYGIITPRYGWGHIRPDHTGTVEQIRNNRTCRVRFPTGLWKAMLAELEVAVNPADTVCSVVCGVAEKMFEDKRFADVTFVLADGEEQAHRAVLAATSDAFAAMFSQPMQESASGKVELPDTKRAAVRTFLRLLYTGKVEVQDWQADQPAAAACPQGKEGAKEGARGQAKAEVVEAPAIRLHAPGHAAEEDEDDEQPPPNTAPAYEDDDDDDEEDEDESEEDEVCSLEENSNSHSGTSCNENPPWFEEQPQRDSAEMPLALLLEVADLAHRYMVHGVLALLVEALKLRLHRHFVELEVCPVSCEEPHWAAMQDIIVFARRNDVLALRLAALQMARRSPVVRKAYRLGRLWPEVRTELSANWPLPPPPRGGTPGRGGWLT